MRDVPSSGRVLRGRCTGRGGRIGLGGPKDVLGVAADASDALAMTRQLAQNFPRYASAVARRVTVSEAVEQEITNNQAKAQGGISVVWLNGAQLNEGDMNPFSCVAQSWVCTRPS